MVAGLVVRVVVRVVVLVVSVVIINGMSLAHSRPMICGEDFGGVASSRTRMWV